MNTSQAMAYESKSGLRVSSFFGQNLNVEQSSPRESNFDFLPATSYASIDLK